MSCHGADHDTALFDGNRRMADKTLIQQVPVACRFRVRRFFRFFLHDGAGKLSECADERSKHQHRHNTKHRVQCRNAYRIHGCPHKSKRMRCVDGIEDRAAEDRAENIDHQMNQRRAPRIQRGSGCAEEYRQRAAHRDSEDDGIGLGERKGSCHAQGLQNTDRRSGRLDDRCKDNAHQDTEQGI